MNWVNYGIFFEFVNCYKFNEQSPLSLFLTFSSGNVAVRGPTEVTRFVVFRRQDASRRASAVTTWPKRLRQYFSWRRNYSWDQWW
jgi:hypothetical protein